MIQKERIKNDLPAESKVLGSHKGSWYWNLTAYNSKVLITCSGMQIIEYLAMKKREKNSRSQISR